MKKEDLVCLVLIAGAAVYVAAHVAFALVRPVLPALVSVLAR